MRQFEFAVAGYRSRITVFPAGERPAVAQGALLRESYILSDTNTEAIAEELATRSRERVVLKRKESLLPGEKEKSLENLQRILSGALEAGMSREALFLVVGGGVLCDLGAFAASVYLRGVRLQLFPTTLLAMVDAAVGGKTGCNVSGYKNMVGTFYPAEEVRIYPALLETLREAEYRSGVAEVIKAALLGDQELLHLLESRREEVLRRDPELLEELIARAVGVKVSVVEEDFREGGRRAILNLGHTYGHALESVGGFGSYTHGEAVAWGIGRALELGRILGITDDEYRRRVERLLLAYGYALDPVSYAPRELIEAMGQDKKRSGGELRFVVQRELCSTEVIPVARELVEKSLAAPVESRYDQ